MWNVTFQPSQTGKGERRRAFLEAPSPGAQGDLCIASGCPEPGSSLALSGLSAGWRFRFLRKLAGRGWQGWSWLPAGQADTEGQGQSAGWQDLPRGEQRGQGEQDFLACRLHRPPLWRAQLLRRPKSANNSAMLLPAGPGSPGYTAARRRRGNRVALFYSRKYKIGAFSPFAAPYSNADRKQINL